MENRLNAPVAERRIEDYLRGSEENRQTIYVVAWRIDRMPPWQRGE
jgi:hypothetical protein